MPSGWRRLARPVLEAFWHAKYFIQMMVKYAKELESAPQAIAKRLGGGAVPI